MKRKKCLFCNKEFEYDEKKPGRPRDFDTTTCRAYHNQKKTIEKKQKENKKNESFKLYKKF